VTRAPGWGFDLDPMLRRVLSVGLGAARTDHPPLADDAWVVFVEHARHHRLDGLLVGAVADGTVATTATQRAEIAHLECRLAADAMWHEGWTNATVEMLRDEGIEVRILKGPAWARLDYPDSLWRPTQDLDLLVHGRDLERGSRSLLAAGGVRLDPDPVDGYSEVVGKGATYAFSDRPEIDLHRLLIWGPFGVRVPEEELWTVRRRFICGGVEHSTLGLEESFVHAGLHMVVLGWRRALNLRDVAQMMSSPHLDVDRLLWLARRWDVEAPLAVAILLAVDEIDVEFAGDLVPWARGHRMRLRDRLELRVERPGDPVSGVEALATWFECPTPEMRRMLWDATVRPAPDTWRSPGERVRGLLSRRGR
jgi:hypothetical protein